MLILLKRSTTNLSSERFLLNQERESKPKWQRNCNTDYYNNLPRKKSFWPCVAALPCRYFFNVLPTLFSLDQMVWRSDKKWCYMLIKLQLHGGNFKFSLLGTASDLQCVIFGLFGALTFHNSIFLSQLLLWRLLCHLLKSWIVFLPCFGGMINNMGNIALLLDSNEQVRHWTYGKNPHVFASMSPLGPFQSADCKNSTSSWIGVSKSFKMSFHSRSFSPVEWCSNPGPLG